MKGPIFLAPCLGLLLAGGSHAQQRPLTGQMLAQPARPATPAPVATPAAAPAKPMATAPTAAPPAPAVASVASTPAAAAAPTSTPAPPPPRPHSPSAGPVHTTHPHGGIGSTTRGLLDLQASSRHAGPSLPILGDQARRSHQRYLQSFEHPIPEFFETRVKDEAASGGG